MKFTGQVIQGVQIGAKFGIATANLAFVGEKPELEEGVYLVHISRRGDGAVSPPRGTHNGLLHFGSRPTFGGDFSAEVHILDFAEEIYGENLDIEILKKERDVQQFQNADALFTQIERDIVRARKFFLRRQIRSQWDELTDNERQTLIDHSIKKIVQNKQFQTAARVFAYAPDRYEIGFVQALAEQFPEKVWCFPRVIDGGDADESKGASPLVTDVTAAEPAKAQLRFYPGEFRDLRTGTFGIGEPDVVGAPQLPQADDLVFVPAVALDHDGHRLGRGGGFYDRWLADCAAPTIGVVPAFAYVGQVPCEVHDQVIDEVIVV